MKARFEGSDIYCGTGHTKYEFPEGPTFWVKQGRSSIKIVLPIGQEQMGKDIERIVDDFLEGTVKWFEVEALPNGVRVSGASDEANLGHSFYWDTGVKE